MTEDGRGQTLAPVGILARFLAWLRARPLLMLVGALLGGLGVAGAQVRYQRGKAAKAQKAADIATGKASQAAARMREQEAIGSVRKADTDAQEAAGRDKAAGEVVGDADAKLRAVAGRWKNPLAKLLLVGVIGAACPPPVDLSGLIAALTDSDAARDAAIALTAYAQQTAALCAQLDARADLVAALEAGRTERDRLISTLTADRDMAWTAWQAEIGRRSVVPTLGRFGWSVGAGACVDADGTLSVCGAGVWGLRF